MNVNNILTYSILGFTVLCLLGGFLFGLIRGFNRALMRLILVVASIAGAWFLRGVIVNLLLKININGKKLEEMITSAFTSSGDIPESMSDLILVFVKILANVIAFMALFFVIRSITGFIFYPLLKLLVKKGENKKAILGAVIGLVQGVIVAFVMCVPLTGLAIQTNELVQSISEIKNEDGSAIVNEEMTTQIENLGIVEYQNSAIGKIYDKCGSWFYNALSTTKDTDGDDISLDSAVKAVQAGVKVYNSLQSNIDTINNSLNNGDGMTAESKDAVISILDTIAEVQNGELQDESTKKVVNTLIKSVAEMAGGDSNSIKISDDFDIADLDTESAKGAVEVLYSVNDREDKTLTEEEIKTMTAGVAKNVTIISAVANDDSLSTSLSDDDKGKIQDELTSLKDSGEITEADMEAAKKLFGITG